MSFSGSQFQFNLCYLRQNLVISCIWAVVIWGQNVNMITIFYLLLLNWNYMYCLSPIVIWNRLNLVLSFLGSQLHLDCRYLRLLCTFSLVCISSHSIFLVVLLLNWFIINIAVKKFLLSNMYISQNCQWNMYTVKSLFYFKMYSLHCKSTLPAVY